MQQYFFDLADFIQHGLVSGEQFTAWLSGEQSDFIRFNHAKVRQAGNVNQLYLTLRLVDGNRHASSSQALTGDTETDQALLVTQLIALRAQLVDVAEDPHLLLSERCEQGIQIRPSHLPDAATMVEEIVAASAGYDLVGILAAGPVFNGYASSIGSRLWHETSSFNFDWSLHAGADKAVKSGYAGFEWDSAELRARIGQAAAELVLLQRPAMTIAPGHYRAYLTPAAVAELLAMFNWGGFSEKELQVKRSPLLKLQQSEASFSPLLSLSENTAEGLAPTFQNEGFIKPDRVSLIHGGQFTGSLISPRTAKEYMLESNSSGSEVTESLHMAAGELPQQDVLKALGTGLYISNLWYLNFSDRSNARITGMTRFATFWVENGEIVAPLNVMRFDDSLFRLLGDQLEALTVERELLIDTSTYDSRQTGSQLLPGALIRQMALVL